MTWFITPARAEDIVATPAADAAHAAPAEGTTTAVAHEGGHEGGFPPFNSQHFPSQLLWLAITFGLLYWLVSTRIAPRIGSILEVRRDRIDADLAEAERARADTDAAAAAYEQSLAEARSKAGAIAAETRAAVAKDVEARRHAAEADASARLAAAEADIAAIKAKAMAEVDTIAVDTTEAIVAALIGAGSRDEASAAVAAARNA